VRWIWIPEWSLPPGRELRQEILPFPACNLVVEPDGITLVGPPTRRSERVLSGSGWAVGALLRPAAAPAMAPAAAPALADLRDSAAAIDEPALLREVAEAMADPQLAPDTRRDRPAGSPHARRSRAPTAPSRTSSPRRSPIRRSSASTSSPRGCTPRHALCSASPTASSGSRSTR
jgi:hypothetical protein